MVSTNILGDVVSNLVGDDVEVVTLMRPGADPHSFEISAAEAARLRSADLVVANGLGLEEGLQQHLDAAAGGGGVATFVAGDAVEVLPYTLRPTPAAPTIRTSGPTRHRPSPWSTRSFPYSRRWTGWMPPRSPPARRPTAASSRSWTPT